MFISDVLKIKGRSVVKVRPSDTVAVAVARLAEHRIGAVVVEDQWMKPVGIFSERDFVNAIARDGAAAWAAMYGSSCRRRSSVVFRSDRIDAVLAAMTLAKVRHFPVIDAGTLNGIVSIGDLVKHRLDEKELEASVLLDLSRMHA